MKKVILNLSVGGDNSWYHRGQNALLESLYEQESSASIVLGRRDTTKLRSVYEDKLDFIRLHGKDADMFLWLDCSITAVRPLDDMWDYIEEHGVYLYQSGANCAQTCNDHCLNSYGLSRDEAEGVHECASNVVGVNMNHHQGRAFFESWTRSLDTGANIGTKWPTAGQRCEESQDPRFLYHRQDQSTASLAAHQAKVKLEPEGHFVSRAENRSYFKDISPEDNIIFVLKGGVGE